MDSITHMAGKGYNATNVESQLDERIFKKKYAELFKNKKVDYLILGASRHMQISSEAVKGRETLNLAISGAKIEDLIAIYQVYKDNHIKANNIILGIDPLFFNSDYGDNWWRSIAEYYYEFEKIEDYINYNKLSDRMFSIDYFRMVINAIKEKKQDYPSLTFLRSYINNGFTRGKDGSIYYPQNAREKEQIEIDNNARDLDITEYKFDTLSEERINKLEILIDSMLNKASNLYVIMLPYHPILYQRIIQRDCIQNTFIYVKQLANKKKIKVFGDYNPKSVGFTEKDFIDATHARKESLDKLIAKSLFNSY
jgi:hypothetical protein